MILERKENYDLELGYLYLCGSIRQLRVFKT